MKLKKMDLDSTASPKRDLPHRLRDFSRTQLKTIKKKRPIAYWKFEENIKFFKYINTRYTLFFLI